MFDLNKKEKPFTSFSGFGGGGLGLSGGVTKQLTYVDDVFSTYLYKGTSSSQSINNGIDLAGEGGLVWIKGRAPTGWQHILVDTERGATKYLMTNATTGEQAAPNTVPSFSSTGFATGSDNQVSYSSETAGFASWTFRKQKGFLDIVTYTGNDTAGRTVAHNLGSVPGMIIVKYIGGTSDWRVYHRSTGNTKILALNTADAAQTYGHWNNTTPTSTHFTLGDSSTVNGSGRTFVAYVFAHDNTQFGTDGDESIIKCGSYTGNGGTNEINLGFEAQWLIIKDSSSATNWFLVNNMMGANSVVADESSVEVDNSYGFDGFKSTGFAVKSNNNNFNGSGHTYIYMAIRRPHKPPELATEVFNVIASDSPRTAVQRPEKVDMYWFTKTGGFSDNLQVADRVRGFQSTSTNGDNAYTTPTIFTNSTNQERTSGNAIVQQDWSGGPFVTGVSSGNTFLNYMFKRAPGFFDIVTYTGNLTARTINHNLSAIPELVIVKNRTDTGGASWSTWTSYLPEGYALLLNDIQQGIDRGTQYWNTNSTFTTTTFGLGNQPPTNQNNHNFVGYLFASLAGISKIGTYSGNTGYNVNVDCGFAAGARFVMIKRTDAEVTGTNSSGWYLWDTARGIESGNDPYLLINKTDSQVTNTDYIDPLSTGFTVTSSAPSSLNVSGGTYLFLAIA